jgi:hypothetical protein
VKWEEKHVLKLWSYSQKATATRSPCPAGTEHGSASQWVMKEAVHTCSGLGGWMARLSWHESRRPSLRKLVRPMSAAHGLGGGARGCGVMGGGGGGAGMKMYASSHVTKPSE